MSFEWKPYLDLCRISNLPTVWTNVLAATVLSGIPFSWADFLILSGALSFFYSGGMCLNDLFDIEEDRISKPFRPLPSQKISIKNSILFTLTLFGLALFLLSLVPNQSAFYPGLILLMLIIVYDRFHKDHPLSVFLMAACRLMVFVISAMAVSGNVGRAVWTGGVAQFIYILSLSLVARHEHRFQRRVRFSLVPMMLVGISILDGILMAIMVSPAWLLAGACGAGLTHLGQRYIRGD